MNVHMNVHVNVHLEALRNGAHRSDGLTAAHYRLAYAVPMVDLQPTTEPNQKNYWDYNQLIARSGQRTSRDRNQDRNQSKSKSRLFLVPMIGPGVPFISGPDNWSWSWSHLNFCPGTGPVPDLGSMFWTEILAIDLGEG